MTLLKCDIVSPVMQLHIPTNTHTHTVAHKVCKPSRLVKVVLISMLYLEYYCMLYPAKTLDVGKLPMDILFPRNNGLTDKCVSMNTKNSNNYIGLFRVAF